MDSPLFGLIVAGQPCTTQPSQILSPTSFLYTIPHPPPSPTTKPTTIITIFLLPGIQLPPQTGAAIYVISSNPSSSSSPSEKFVGAIGPGKESIFFRIKPKETAMIGILIEPAQAILEKMAANEGALVKASSAAGGAGQGGGGEANVLLSLAEKVIGNAFNYLASFSVDVPGKGVMVPLKAFEEWWKKFQSKARADPKFLERDGS
ncbi:hypothetical protein QBC38DRAFT_358097 [Podospora fimiseda]|uniref:Hikeshi-like domain-containing protein n=1 Tax=Podospora fimiseda TaxID=252190 RepID=A0AAN7BV52_9PEZI|nr:hypothetical protein QBC38DRAFT_358097 [Podospora fimiseda]